MQRRVGWYASGALLVVVVVLAVQLVRYDLALKTWSDAADAKAAEAETITEVLPAVAVAVAPPPAAPVDVAPPPEPTKAKSAPAPAETDPLLQTDYIFDGINNYAYLYPRIQGAWKMYGSDGSGDGVPLDELNDLHGDWILAYNHTPVTIVEPQTDIPSIIAVKLKPGVEVENSEGKTFTAEGKQTLYVWEGAVRSKGSYKSKADRQTSEASQIARERASAPVPRSCEVGLCDGSGWYTCTGCKGRGMVSLTEGCKRCFRHGRPGLFPCGSCQMR